MTARPTIDNDWAAPFIEELRAGATVWFRPRGHSMAPRVYDGQLCEVRPANVATVAVDDIVLCLVNGKVLFHAVRGFRRDGAVQIANAKGRVNGWTSTIYGKLVRVSP